MKSGKKRNAMSKPKTIGQILRAEEYRLGVGLSPSAALKDANRDASRDEKILFLRICYRVCPGFRITEPMKPLLNDIVRWCLMLKGKYDPDRGLWLWGDIGTGKSTMLEIIKQYCHMVRPPAHYRDEEAAGLMCRTARPYGFRTTNMSKIAGLYSKDGYSAIEQYITTCRQAFDEVGRECIPASHFGNMENVFQYIIQGRYDARRDDFTHVTSNLSPEQISAVYGEHIYDRCFEMFNFVEMSGESWR